VPPRRAAQLLRPQASQAERIAAILKALDEAYPDAVCALNHRTPWELLVATILSAQCTDVRVNMVTPELFRRFPTPAAMAKAQLPELEELIRTTGFFRNKAKSVVGAAKRIVSEFGGQVPEEMPTIETVSSSVDIRYDADDLEIPAFMRKRGEG